MIESIVALHKVNEIFIDVFESFIKNVSKDFTLPDGEILSKVVFGKIKRLALQS